MLRTQNAISLSGVIRCNVCRGNIVCDPDSGENVCTSCGTVCEVQLSSSISEYCRDGHSLGERDSAYKMTYDKNLPSVIGSENFDGRGRRILDSYEFQKMRRLDNLTLSRDPKRRSLEKASAIIRRATEMLAAGEAVADAAYEIYQRCNEVRLGRRKAISGLALACVYVVMKEFGIARSAREIEEVTREIGARNVRHYCSYVLNELKIRSTSSDASSFVSRIAARAGLDGRVERRAIDILIQIKDDPLMISKKSLPLAASALYVASELCGEPVTQLRIAGASEVTPVTIRKRSTEIRKLLGFPEQVSAPLEAAKEEEQQQQLQQHTMLVAG